jgi:hypothetical protein
MTPVGGGIYSRSTGVTISDPVVAWTNYSVVPGDPTSTFRGAWQYKGDYTLTSEQADQIKAGLWYVLIQSANFPSGELGGQIIFQDPEGDADGDGVPNKADQCPNTPRGSVVDATGCSIEQLVVCGAGWKSHDDYVRAVAAQADRFLNEQRIGSDQRDAIVQQATASTCGNILPSVDDPAPAASITPTVKKKSTGATPLPR